MKPWNVQVRQCQAEAELPRPCPYAPLQAYRLLPVLQQTGLDKDRSCDQLSIENGASFRAHASCHDSRRSTGITDQSDGLVKREKGELGGVLLVGWRSRRAELSICNKSPI